MAAPKVRIYELSKELGLGNKDVMALLEKEFGIELKSHSSSVDKDVADKLVDIVRQQKNSPIAAKPNAAAMEVAAPSRPVESKPATAVPPQSQAAAQVQTDRPVPPSKMEPPKAGQNRPMTGTVGAVGTRPAQPQGQPPQGHQAPPRPQQQDRPYQQQQGGRPPERTGQVGNIRSGNDRPAHGGGQRPHHEQHQRPQQHGQPRPEQRPDQRQENRPEGRPENRPDQQRHHVAASTNTPAHKPQQPGGQPMDRRPDQGGASKPGGGKPQGSSHGKRVDNKGGGGMSGTQVVVETPPADTAPKIVKIHDPLTVSELAQKLKLRETEIIKHLFMKGAMVTVTQTLDVAYAKSIAQEFGFEIDEALHPALEKGADYSAAVIGKKPALDEAKFKHLQKRSPVISIMGHVDHGKTSLLDAIRETRHKIVDTEAGGITQSIGAYTVEKDNQHIVFLDTPGHEAFTSMRMRGAKATDIAILVVAADDGVMPQTIEALNHAKAADIPIIVAVNKIDKAGADPDKVLVQLSEHGLVSEKWGGDTVTVEVSALQKLGLDDLLEMILLVSELLELKADATVPGEGVIIEAQLDKRKGPTATALVQNGSLKVGDNVLIGSVGGRVRALFNDSGERVIKAGPAMPVEILGLNEVPRAGDHFQVIRDEKKFKQMLAASKMQERDQRLGSRSMATGFATSAPRQQESGETANLQQEFNVIVKSDTQGSAEAVNGALSRMSTEEIKVKVLHTGTGDISEADVMLASASNALIIGFNVKEDSNAQRVAEQLGVKIYKYDVIYHINEEMEKLMLGKLSPDLTEVEAGQAEVRQLFTVGKNVVIAGCMVTKGKVIRNAKALVTRDGKEVFTGTLDNLKRFKDDAKEVAAGYECGISFSKFNDLQIGDVITIIKVEETERTSL